MSAGAEASVRQAIAAGDHQTALARAKELHKANGSVASEVLLVEAYIERVRALAQRDLVVEARSLANLVRQRYPSAKKRLEQLQLSLAGSRSLDQVVQPLNDPELGAAARSAIDDTLRHDVWDLAALARCEALAADHPLRRAAAALANVLVAATTGPIADETLKLPEVSHRSPLAPWKLLICAIASFHRGDDEACARYLEGIDPASVPARVVPVVRALQGSEEAAAALSPAAAQLRARITEEPLARRALHELDQALESGPPRRILKAVRAAVEQCRRSAPDRIESLRQHISVRCAVADLDAAKVRTAMGGGSRHDAAFLRMLASAMEESREPEDVVQACSLWDEFQQAAVQEGWFTANGAEAAAVSLHMAELVGRLPTELLRELQRGTRSHEMQGGEQRAYLFPDELYQRACLLDPHHDGFLSWMTWAVQQRGGQAKRVATAWHKIRPRDIEPLVRLMHDADAHGRFSSALKYVSKVEQIDPLHPGLREMRLRLLVGNAVRHLQQQKPWLAADDLTQISALPAAKKGDRPALTAALGFLVSATRNATEDAAARRTQVERLLGSSAAAAVLIHAVATASRQPELGQIGTVKKLSTVERASLPTGVARVAVLTADVGLSLEIPRPWAAHVAKQYSAAPPTLDVAQLRRLAEWALRAGRDDLAYAVTAAGLACGDATAARFLLLRALSVIEHFERHVICARAAAELAREQRDAALVEEAAELGGDSFEFTGISSVTVEQARDVLEREKAAGKPPHRNRPGPDYSDLIGEACQCVRCRRARGEDVGQYNDGDDFEPFDEFDDGDDFGVDLPPELAELFAAELAKGMRRGETVGEVMARLVSGGRTRKRR